MTHITSSFCWAGELHRRRAHLVPVGAQPELASLVQGANRAKEGLGEAAGEGMLVSSPFLPTPLPNLKHRPAK